MAEKFVYPPRQQAQYEQLRLDVERLFQSLLLLQQQRLEKELSAEALEPTESTASGQTGGQTGSFAATSLSAVPFPGTIRDLTHSHR